MKPSQPRNLKPFRIEIHDINERGQGVGRIIDEPRDSHPSRIGKVSFVEGALPGELVETELIRETSGYTVLRTLNTLLESPDRTAPDCGSFPKCGSCPLRHLAYEAELRLKEKRIRHYLSPFISDHGMIRPVIGMASPEYYRGKTSFPVGYENRKCIIGQYRQDSHDVTALHGCRLNSRFSLSMIEKIETLARRDGVRPYDEKMDRGTLAHILVRTGFSSQEGMLVFVVRDMSFTPILRSWIPDLRNTAEASGHTLRSVWISVKSRRGNRVLSDKNILVDGNETVDETVNGVTYAISPKSFFQVNPAQAAILFREIASAAQLKPDDTVYDLYCGVGAISLQLAKALMTDTSAGARPRQNTIGCPNASNAPSLRITQDEQPIGNEKSGQGQIIGVESVPAAIEDARMNAERNGISNASFVAADVLPWLRSRETTAAPPDVIVVDPPRKGLDPELIPLLRKSGCRRLVYVSCNPVTLARDLRLLTTTASPVDSVLSGNHLPSFSIEYVQPVDMFPRTTHVETVVLMSRIKD